MTGLHRLTQLYPIRLAIVIILYGLAGWLGLLLAVPPGYATVLWPASGIAVAALLLYGAGLWPGVLLGSLIVNLSAGHAAAPDGIAATGIAVAVAIAVGSTIQALVAAGLVRRVFGVPVNLSSRGDLVLFALCAGPLPCLVAASIGVGALYFAGLVAPEALARNWFTWWFGDVAGVLIVLPLALVAPWRNWSLRWSGQPVTRFTAPSLLALIVPLALTLYAWKMTTEISEQKNQASFAVLAEDSLQALLHRISSYKQSLDGGSGLFLASASTTAQEWETFVEALNIEENLPGINGIGFIQPVGLGGLQSFLDQAFRDGVGPMQVHPDTPAPARFVIKYIEPRDRNLKALGLNIAFETNRYEAAVRARDTGEAVITRRIFLVQDTTKSAGFLLLRPLYANGRPLRSITERRRAFLGWVYAPFIAPLFMDNLTASQGVGVDLSVYDGGAADPEQLIYSSKAAGSGGHEPAYQVKKVLPVMGQQWTVSWQSTPGFEASVASNEATLILVGGMLLTVLFGALLYSHARREESIRNTVEMKTHAIAARERENRAIVDTAVVGFIVLDCAGHILSVNRAVEAIFGHAADEIRNQHVETILSCDAITAATLATAVGEGEAASDSPVVIKTRSKAGKRLYLDVQRNDWSTESGDLRHTLIIRDVTAQRLAVEALEANERRWNHALEGAGIGVFDIDFRRGQSFVSDTWKQMLGFSPSDDIEPRAEWLARIHPEDLPALKAVEDAYYDTGTFRSEAEYRIRRKDNVWIWLRSDSMVIERDKAGKPMRVIGTQTEITELKTAEAALRSSEERVRLALRDAPVGMAMLDLNGGWIRVNQALCAFLGYSEAEFMERDLAAVTHPDDVGIDHEQMAQMIAQTLPTYQVEKRFLHRDGRALWCLFSVSLVHDHDGQAYLVSHVQDINDRKEMDRLKNEFVATVSHELRTPLTSIRGSLGLIQGVMAKDVPPAATRLLTIAVANCERLVALINDILDLEKITAGMMAFETVLVDPNAAVTQAIEANQPYFERFGVSVAFTATGEGEAWIPVDPARFQQVLANLLSNAAKFSPQGGVIDVAIEPIDGAIRISVTDHGTGIPAEFQSRIFDRFTQADSSATREKGGTGLGLHITRQIIETMGGTIDFANVPGAGARFWIDMPCQPAEPAALPPGRSEAEAAYDGPRGLPVGLHLEDDGDFVEILSAMMRGKVELVSAGSLAEARQALRDRHFDFAVLDLTLPDGHGLAFLDELSRTDGGRVPTLVLSAADVMIDDDRVDEILVKSRVTENRIVASILSLASGESEAPEPGRLSA
ncbi:PAS domain S-box protein [Aurantimonas coralicida]|uniref:PAS domain S-box protein n=1 Tax=Aurantimonas coralicida TaxID=182270 RepID=UPI001E657F15|nr:PAS domain S-box protein [Aurantimonas coralicida]MCD1641615.1 PAS domain S-box protein [Aurantimonas coralicida]